MNAELANMMAAEPNHLQELVQALNAHTGDPAKTKQAMSEISGIPEDDVMHILAAEVRLQTHGVYPMNRQHHLDPSDPRFVATANFLPNFCGWAFAPVYGQMQISTLTLIRNSAKGEPQLLLVGVNGLGGFHRINSGIVYFEINRMGTGTVIQKCWNGKDSDDWVGEHRSIEPLPHMTLATTARKARLACNQLVRNMFYLPQEQTYEVCLRVVSEQAQRLQRRKQKKGEILQPQMIGNHHEYEALVNDVLLHGPKRPYDQFIMVMEYGMHVPSGIALSLLRSPEDENDDEYMASH
jgi:hypothetical protein